MKNDGSKRRWRAVLPVILFLIGLVIFLYPVFTDWLYQREVQQKKEIFQGQIKDASSEEPGNGRPFEELYQELKRRNEALFAGHQKELSDPWAYEQPDVDLTQYGLEGNVIGFLSVPKMDIELPVLLGANAENMRLGAAHLTETSYPVGGENTNCVIAAHRGYSKASMFRHIERLEPGDKIYIQNFRETLTYEVVQTQIISPTDIEQLLIREGRDMVTLITCHPYRHNYQRYVVYCERVNE